MHLARTEKQSNKADCVKAVCRQHIGLSVRVQWTFTCGKSEGRAGKGPDQSLFRCLSWKYAEQVLTPVMLPPVSRPQPSCRGLFEQDLAKWGVSVPPTGWRSVWASKSPTTVVTSWAAKCSWHVRSLGRIVSIWGQVNSSPGGGRDSKPHDWGVF